MLMRAPKARNMIARGKREAQRNASPLVQEKFFHRALKVRNMNISYSAPSELHRDCDSVPGATRLTLFGACPWLSYSAPSALEFSDVLCKPKRVSRRQRTSSLGPEIFAWHLCEGPALQLSPKSSEYVCVRPAPVPASRMSVRQTTKQYSNRA